MTVDGTAPPRVGHRYHVRAEQHPHEVVTFTAWCRLVVPYPDGSIETEWENGVIMRAAGVLYYPNDPWPVDAGVSAALKAMD